MKMVGISILETRVINEVMNRNEGRGKEIIPQEAC